MMPKWEYIMLHHSLTADNRTVSWPAIRRYHTTEMGMHAIGYAFGVELCGPEYEAIIGRSLYQIGAHCKQGEMNHKAISICLVGNFDKAPPPPAQMEVLRDRLLVPLMEGFKIPPSRIVFHRDYAGYKTCPGTMLTKAYLAQFIPGVVV